VENVECENRYKLPQKNGEKKTIFLKASKAKRLSERKQLVQLTVCTIQFWFYHKSLPVRSLYQKLCHTNTWRTHACELLQLHPECSFYTVIFFLLIAPTFCKWMSFLMNCSILHLILMLHWRVHLFQLIVMGVWCMHSKLVRVQSHQLKSSR